MKMPLRSILNNYARRILMLFLRYGIPSILMVALVIAISTKMSRNHSQQIIESDEYGQGPISSSSTNKKWTSLAEAVLDCSSAERHILLSLTDISFLDITLNFYHTSLKRFSINNYLLISSDEEACRQLSEQQINCFVYMHDKNAGKATEYGNEDFNRKMHIRTFMIYETLKRNYTVIHSDVDVFFLGNPLENIREQCAGKCDIAVMWDHIVYNAGFLFAKPTPNTILLYENMLALAKKYPTRDDQFALNQLLKVMPKRNGLKFNILDKEKFLNGFDYFEAGRRMFQDDGHCKNCLVLHNNWIVSKEAKIYRFKEHHMWYPYSNMDYYTSKTAKYLLYDNPISIQEDPHNYPAHVISKLEIKALTAALSLGKMLDRIVILPAFHCDRTLKLKDLCPLNALLRISDFDLGFHDHYREHSFLTNPMVPSVVTGSQSPVYVMLTPMTMNLVDVESISDNSVFHILQPQGRSPSYEEIMKWLNSTQEVILRIHSLYDLQVVFPGQQEHQEFTNKVKDSFTNAVYRQYRN